MTNSKKTSKTLAARRAAGAHTNVRASDLPALRALGEGKTEEKKALNDVLDLFEKLGRRNGFAPEGK